MHTRSQAPYAANTASMVPGRGGDVVPSLLDIRRVQMARRALRASPQASRSTCPAVATDLRDPHQCVWHLLWATRQPTGCRVFNKSVPQFRPRQACLADPWKAVALNPLSPARRRSQGAHPHRSPLSNRRFRSAPDRSRGAQSPARGPRARPVWKRGCRGECAGTAELQLVGVVKGFGYRPGAPGTTCG